MKQKIAIYLAGKVLKGALWIEKILSDPTYEAKRADDIERAMEYYKKTQLDLDEPMQKLLTSNGWLKKRLSVSLV